MMHQTHEQFESTIGSRHSAMQTKKSRAGYEEGEFDFEPCVNPEAWLAPRLNYLEYPTHEILETRPASLEDNSEMARWSSVFGMDLSACMMQKNPLSLYIDMPPDDWSWCADPL
jgi:hypothetical protein